MDGRPLVGVLICLVACVPSEDLKTYSDGSTARDATRATATADRDSGVGASAPVAVMVPPSAPMTGEVRGAERSVEPAPLDPAGANAAAATGTAGGTGPGAGDRVTTPAPATSADPAEEAPGEAPRDSGESESVAVPTDAEPDPGSEAPAPRPQFRFVRFVADGAVQGPYTALAEFNVLDGAGQPIDRTGWVASADSEELSYVGGARAALAIDGVVISLWHTAWFQVNPPPAHPHTLQLDMGTPHEVSGFRYLGRQDGSLDGRVTRYRFFVSVDGIEWGEPVATGTLENSTAEQEVQLPL